ncbi:alpha/beta hydrolase [Nocardioides anomalus]|uniref:Alpha/beta hydrolase n=1 Tax=Nocardioides anomalus TaxID=2712223 RepID=A0A6G6WL00_9ACTN|nr:alpha/beta hydrolase [Nocardioides anomalus]
MLFVHGFGCDQHMWRLVAPAFERDHRVVLLDLVGAGGSDPAAWDPDRYVSLDAYAEDLLAVVHALDLRDVVLVGHSVSAMSGMVATVREPDRFAGLVMIGPSPCFIDDGDYRGGFSRSDIDDLLSSLESNYLGWSATMAPAIVGNPERPELGAELTESFCRMAPDVARQFARVTFLSDCRTELPHVSVPTLVLQSQQDVIAPVHVGEYVAAQVPDGRLVVLDATGHCPHLSAPEETVAAIREFLGVSTPVPATT